MTKQFPIEFYISGSACIYGCLLLILLPIELVTAIFAAAAIHEICHILALCLFRVPLLGISLCIGGTQIHTPPLQPVPELLCTAAGPLGSLMCLLLIRRFPLLAVCALIQGLFNLLPVYPLDGGRILHCFCLLLYPDQVFLICSIAKWCVSILVITSCIFLACRTKDSFFLLFALYFLLQVCARRKPP